MKKIIIISFYILCLSLSTVFAQIDSQWRGPNRDGVYPNETLLKQWPAEGPKLLFSIKGLEKGYSSAAVTTDRIYLTGESGGTGSLFAFDKVGKSLWKSSYGPEWDGSHPGSRTTPTVVGDKIYLLSAQGQALCFDTKGKKLWTVDMMKEFGARNLEWGVTESPLVDGDRVFFTPGGNNVLVVALDRNSGKTIWEIKGNGETSGYCTPVLVKHGSRRLILTMSGNALVAIDADTGKQLWSKSHITDYVMNANTPIYHEDNVFAFSGYGTGGQMFKISSDGKSAEKVWDTKFMDSQMGGAVLMNSYIYGGGHNKRGWYCLDWKSGNIQYSTRELGGKGNIIFADGLLYLYSERGDVALVMPNPQKFEPISSFRMRDGSGPHWAHLVINNGKLFVRHGDVLNVYDIAR